MRSANEAVIELKQTAIGSFALELALLGRIPVSLTPLRQVVAGLVLATPMIIARCLPIRGRRTKPATTPVRDSRQSKPCSRGGTGSVCCGLARVEVGRSDVDEIAIGL